MLRVRVRRHDRYNDGFKTGEHKQVKGARAERAKYRTCNEVNRGIDPE